MWHNTDDAVLATIDAMKSICQLLIVKRIVTADELAHSFEHQGEGYLAKRNPDGAAVMAMLLQFLGHREQADRLRRAKPAGSA